MIEEIGAPPQEAFDFIDEIVRKDQELQAIPVREYQPRRSRAPFAAFLTAILLALTGVNIYVATHRVDPFSSTDIQAEAVLHLLVAIDAIEEYRTEFGRLPPDLATVNADADELFFSSRDRGYHLQIQAGTELLSYSDGGDRTWLETRFAALVP